MLSVVLLKRLCNVSFFNQLFSVHRNQFGSSIVHHPDQVHRVRLPMEDYVILVVKLPFVNYFLVVLVNVNLHRLFFFDVFSSHVSIVLSHVCVQVDSNLLGRRDLDEELWRSEALFKQVLSEPSAILDASRDLAEHKSLLLFFSFSFRQGLVVLNVSQLLLFGHFSWIHVDLCLLLGLLSHLLSSVRLLSGFGDGFFAHIKFWCMRVFIVDCFTNRNSFSLDSIGNRIGQMNTCRMLWVAIICRRRLGRDRYLCSRDGVGLICNDRLIFFLFLSSYRRILAKNSHNK